ncbi:LysR family transcriptional regulator [Brevibacterium samyangense]|uniref:LysR family transcriptional regulator n=1 Tax=Brevibacterium samyangense TaxID=366888 RepID=A0ABP5EYT6_9MICO
MISRVDDFRFFGVVAASRSLTEAGRTLGISVSGVSRRLSALENDLGFDLVVRDPRSLTLTPEGRRLADGARKLAVDAEALELSSEPVDLSTATFDLMMSVGTLKDSALVYKRLVSNRRVICASPAYLHRHGAPREPRDLHDHRCLLLDQHDVNFNRWEFVVDGEVEAVTVDGDLRCNDGDVVVRWCLEGKGIMLRSLWHVQEHLASGRLVRVLPDLPTVDADVYLLRPRSEHVSARVRTLAEHLIAEVPKRVVSE